MTTETNRRRLDPTGRRALFETPVSAPADQLRTGAAKRGREALFSTGSASVGTVLVECSTCTSRTRVGLADIAIRLASFSVFAPVIRRQYPHRIKCPACGEITWCKVGWTA